MSARSVRACVVGLAAAAGCAALLGTPAAAQPATGGTGTHERGGPDVIAHRGSSGMAPENTEAAIELAIEQNADYVEIDVQRTSDGRLVNFHDCTLERTTDVEEVFPGRDSYRVSDFTWDELSQLDAGSWFHDSYAGEPIVPLHRVFALTSGRTNVLAEISPCEQYEGLAADLAEALLDHPGEAAARTRDDLAVQSFEIDDLREFHALLPDVPVGFLDAEVPTGAELADLAGWADQVNPQYTVTDQALVDRLHDLGYEVNVWTVDEPGAMRRMVDLGVDGIITDYPQSLTQP
ncbi:MULTISPECIES: glycerophosphodiester phosphodiesterase [Streptomyces]|uniref:glycerophosphodiester phosphodiesterase n=1 Tax=Streptomyces TaxID=1883 RepID=UPI001D03A512|nr:MULTISPECIES: glycerophosphodiester phosphodiesterase family protein [Streptomyces]